MIFDGEGRLWPAIVSGASAVLPTSSTCWVVPRRLVSIGLQHRLYTWSWFVQLGYTGPATTLAVEFGGAEHDVMLSAGRDDVVFPAPGKGGTVTVMNIGSASGGCLRYLTVGTMQASAFGQPVPAAPVSG